MRLLPSVANAVTLRRDGEVICTALPLPKPSTSEPPHATARRARGSGIGLALAKAAALMQGEVTV